MNGPRAPRFVPCLEQLESRCLLAARVSQNAGVLLILGDNGRNNILINDNGTNNAGAITVFADRATLTTTTPIYEIRVRARGGDDNITYNLANGLSRNVFRRVRVDLGNGNKFFVANLTGGLQTGSVLDLIENGGIGRDNITVNAASSTNVAAGAFLFMTLNGGTQNNQILVNYEGQLQGQVLLTATGGPQVDKISAHLLLDTGSNGLVTGGVAGGAGLNDLTLTVNQQATGDTPGVDATLDGGPDFSLCRHTANVAAQNCSEDMVVT